MPEQARQKRRQIMSDETSHGVRLDTRADENTWPNESTWPPEDPWVRNFIVRLARMLRKTGAKN
jgi:hypothetical protein